MKIVQLNITCGMGSTGKICIAVSELLTKTDVENYILYTSGVSSYPAGEKYMSSFEQKWQALKSRMLGNYGFQSKKATQRLITKLDQIAPDIVHLHNLHGHNIHLGLLLTYLKAKKIKVFWTFHDCWAFTGYCMYYDMVACNKWETECKRCIQRKRFSWFFDRSNYLYQQKKKLCRGLDLTVVTPSNWLAEQVSRSFLRDYPIKVINNGIDLEVFSHRESDFRKQQHLEDKHLVLGVAFGWGVRKGLDYFIELSRRLDESYQIVLVGTSDEIDKELPENIISIHSTDNQKKLAEIYSSADVFVNPTREDNFPTTHIESLACGTPVITFDVGGSAEMLDETCGCVVPKGDIEALESSIRIICETKPYTTEACVIRAKKYNAIDRFQDYIKLYTI